MTTKAQLTQLAERVKSLTGPDREVAHDVLRACGWTTEGAFVFNPNGMRHMGAIPDPTASLDAAMSLVPEGWKLRQMAFSAPCADDRKWHLNLHGGLVGQNTFVGHGSTPALALVAAALLARAEECGE